MHSLTTTIADIPPTETERFGPLPEIDETAVMHKSHSLAPMPILSEDHPQADIPLFDLQRSVVPLATQRGATLKMDFHDPKFLKDYKVFNPEDLYYEKVILRLGRKCTQPEMFSSYFNSLKIVESMLASADTREKVNSSRKILLIFITNVALQYYVHARRRVYKRISLDIRLPPWLFLMPPDDLNHSDENCVPLKKVAWRGYDVEATKAPSFNGFVYRVMLHVVHDMTPEQANNWCKSHLAKRPNYFFSERNITRMPLANIRELVRSTDPAATLEGEPTTERFTRNNRFFDLKYVVRPSGANKSPDWVEKVKPQFCAHVRFYGDKPLIDMYQRENDVEWMVLQLGSMCPKTDLQKGLLGQLIKRAEQRHRLRTLQPLTAPECLYWWRLSTPNSSGAKKQRRSFPVLIKPKPQPWRERESHEGPAFLSVDVISKMASRPEATVLCFARSMPHSLRVWKAHASEYKICLDQLGRCIRPGSDELVPINLYQQYLLDELRDSSGPYVRNEPHFDWDLQLCKVHQALRILGKNEASVLKTMIDMWRVHARLVPSSTTDELVDAKHPLKGEQLRPFLQRWASDVAQLREQYAREYDQLKNQVVNVHTKAKLDDILKRICQDSWNGRDAINTVRDAILAETVANSNWMAMALSNLNVSSSGVNGMYEEFQPIKARPIENELIPFVVHHLLDRKDAKQSQAYDMWAAKLEDDQIEFRIHDALAPLDGKDAIPTRTFQKVEDLLQYLRKVFFEKLLLPVLRLVELECPLPRPRYANGDIWRPNPIALSELMEPFTQSLAGVSKAIDDKELIKALKEERFFSCFDSPFKALSAAYMLQAALQECHAHPDKKLLMDKIHYAIGQIALDHPDVRVDWQKAQRARLAREMNSGSSTVSLEEEEKTKKKISKKRKSSAAAKTPPKPAMVDKDDGDVQMEEEEEEEEEEEASPPDDEKRASKKARQV